MPKRDSTCTHRHATQRCKSHGQALARAAQFAYTHTARNTTQISKYAYAILGSACCCFKARALLPEITWAWVCLLSGAASIARMSLRGLQTSYHAEGVQKGLVRVRPGSSGRPMHLHHFSSHPAILDCSTPCPRDEEGVCLCGSESRHCHCHFHAWPASQSRSPTLQACGHPPPFLLPAEAEGTTSSIQSVGHRISSAPFRASQHVTCRAHQARSSAMLHSMTWYGGAGLPRKRANASNTALRKANTKSQGALLPQ